MFDWLRFLNTHGIPYVTSGPNATKQQPSCQCPFCGTADPSQHMSISLRGAGWRCFRNPRAHSGRSRSRLIQALLSCSVEEAKRLAGEEVSPPPADNDLAAQVSKNLGLEYGGAITRSPRKLEFPPEIKPLTQQGVRPLAAPFWGYLKERGYATPSFNWLVLNYGLHYATRGPFRYRLIIPIHDTEGRLQTWTGRSIVSGEPTRYKTLVTQSKFGYSGPLALTPPGQLLLGLPLLLRVPNPQTLVLCEGPFDAMRVTTLGRDRGVYGTCLFGLNISAAQVTLLDRLMSRFNRLVLLLDPDAQYLTLRIKEHLTPLMITDGKLPEGVEDPGALPTSQGRELVQSWA